MGLRDIRFGAGICAHNEEHYIAYAIAAVYEFASVIAISLNTGTPWGGKPEPLDDTERIVRQFPDPMGKIHLMTGQWNGEVEQRNDNLNAIRDEIDYYMIVDADEIYSRDGLRNIKNYVSWRPHIGQFRIGLNTYWKTNPFYRIDPPEPLKASVITRVRADTKFVDLRRTNQRWRAIIPRRVAVCHHFSYARPTEKIVQKLANFSHKDEILPNWLEDVWSRWDDCRDMENLHPVRPAAYRRAVPVMMDKLPEVMRDHPFAVSW